MKSIKLLPNDPETCEKIFKKATGGRIDEVIASRNEKREPRIKLHGKGANGIRATVEITKAAIIIDNANGSLTFKTLKRYGYCGV